MLMKIRFRILSPCVARAVAVLSTAVFVAGAPSSTWAAGVVGTGTAASCSDAALDAALAGGGLVTFDCGGPATIDISTGTGTKMIAVDTTIDGGGLITISGGDAVGLFSVNSGVAFTVENLTIANGHIGDGNGGGIANHNGSLTVANSTFTGNSVGVCAFGCTGSGGGIDNEGGTLTVTNSTFAGNSAGAGGGLSNVGGSTVTVTNSTFSDNSGHEDGGGISIGGGTLTVTDSTFTSNIAGDGGGINKLGGTLTVTNSTFSGNRAFAGGGIFNAGLGAGETLTVTNSTFSGNSGDGGPQGAGGGICNVGTLAVTDSTFTGNSAGAGGGLSNAGGRIVTVANSTFSDNSGGAGAGIFNDDRYGTSTVTNTILAGSASGGNCSHVTDGGHNLDSGTSCGFSAANASLSNTDPQLDPAGLQDNGGPTQTVALCTAVGAPVGCTAASPAIGAGDQTVCAAAPVNDRDQRGFVRPSVGHTQCSIGAYEADAVPPAPCIGDCDADGMVAINELVLGVNMALDLQPVTACPAFQNAQAMVDIAQLVTGVKNALNGCGA